MSDRALSRDVACPFCALVCDDLAIEVVEDGAIVRGGGCAISKAQFERANSHPTAARTAGAACPREAAIEVAARILRQARLPVFGGLATDIEGMRGVLALADRIGGVVDHAGSHGLFADLTALRDIGVVTTTFSELRNRADLLLIVGPDPATLLPRFLERCYPHLPTLIDAAPPPRRLIRLGPPAADAALAPAGIDSRLIPCPLEDLAPRLAELRAVLGGRSSRGPAAVADARLLELAKALKSARYPVIAWATSLLPPGEADLLSLTLAEIVRDLNRTQRAAGLPLGGSENLTGAHQVCLWQSGFPLRTSFATGEPKHDPVLYAAGRLIESGEADALVWISALNGTLPPPLPPELPLILLAAPGAPPSTQEPAVYLPVGRPGIDHAGQIFRGDGVVALPLAELRSSALPSVGATLSALGAALEERAP
jgi:formylmethanofuran dehydrogenase subunit B